MNYIGVELGCSALSRKASSAAAILDDTGQLTEEPRHFRKAYQLLEVVSRYNPQSVILAVDAPRSVPDHTKENYTYRSCEKDIKRINPYAGSFVSPGVATLFIRWYEIEEEHLQNIKVIETYPGVVWKILKLPGTPKTFGKNQDKILTAVGELIKGTCEGFSHDQVDAVLCAYTAFCYCKGKISWFGRPGEGLIITPAVCEQKPLPSEDERIEERFRRFPSMQQTLEKWNVSSKKIHHPKKV